MDVRELMHRAVRQWGPNEAITAGTVRLTYDEAWERGVRFANLLIGTGLRPGDRVAVLEDNSLEASDFYLACTAGGFVRVPLYPRNARSAHRQMLENTQCRVAVVSEHYASELEGMDREVDGLAHVLVRDATYEGALANQSTRDPAPAIDEDDPYIIRHTAGTTGRSKGVAYSHRMWLSAARDWFYGFPPVELGDACLHVGPISHASGYFFTPIWMSGGRNVLLPKFDPAQTLEVMERERIAYMFAVPTMLAALARHESAPERDWSDLEVICVGGAPISESTLRRARDVFGDVLYQIYGQTEVVPATFLGPREWFADVPGSTPMLSAGRATPYVELRVLDPVSRRPLATDAEGEIAVRADGQMTGFWNDPEASGDRIVDGWVLTGDVGRLDRNGYLYVLDRAGDMIVSGGFNIYPAELENAILELPAVIEAAVFAVPSEKWGESPAAVCVVEDDGVLTPDAVQEHCVERLGSYKRPALVVVTTEPLPKSPVGKVLRKVLREPYWLGHDRRVAGS